MTDNETIKLWVLTIDGIEETATAEFIKARPILARKFQDLAEDLRDSFGEYLVDAAMTGKL